MKNLIIASFIVLGLSTVQAQNVTLNVKLKPIQTLVVNSGQKIVDLEYSSKDSDLPFFGVHLDTRGCPGAIVCACRRGQTNGKC